MPPHRVMIVEDSRQVSRVLRSSLESLGLRLEVVELFSGEEAILEFQRAPFDLVVADIKLPGMTGLELVSKLRAQTPELKVIFITGLTDPEIRQQLAQADADAYFFKPVEPAAFVEAVERVLRFEKTPSTGEKSKGRPGAEGLADCMAGLRGTLQAAGVFLLDDESQVLLRAGDWPDPNMETNLLPDVRAVLIAGGGISRWLGRGRVQALSHFRGEVLDLFVAPVGESHALLSAVPEEVNMELDKVEGAMLAAGEEILKILSEATGSLREQVPSPADVEVADDDSGDPELESLLQQEEADRPQDEDLDAFWDAAAQGNISREGSSGSLSYDQARQLGLAPGEKADAD